MSENRRDFNNVIFVFPNEVYVQYSVRRNNNRVLNDFVCRHLTSGFPRDPATRLRESACGLGASHQIGPRCCRSSRWTKGKKYTSMNISVHRLERTTRSQPDEPRDFCCSYFLSFILLLEMSKRNCLDLTRQTFFLKTLSIKIYASPMFHVFFICLAFIFLFIHFKCLRRKLNYLNIITHVLLIVSLMR